jgi:outer membrane biosynthesis protein TonB
MKFSALTKSIIFHGLVVVVLSGAFLFKDDIVEVKETPIQVSFVTEDAPVKEDIKKPKPVEDTPPPIEDKPQPAPKALEQPKPKEAEPAPKTQEKMIERVKPKPAPQKPKEKPKPKPEPKVEKPKEAEDEKDTQIDFTSVLKNLQDTMPVDTDRDGPKLTSAPVSQAMTAGEVNAMIRQIQGCWSILPGAAKAETLAVVVQIMMNPDRTVRAVSIADTARYQSDPFFRAAADNAIRAVKHPDCTPLDLPPNKFDTWKEIEFNFDPGRMF